MSQKTKRNRSSETAEMRSIVVVKGRDHRGKVTKIKFGDVTIAGRLPDERVIRANVESSTDMLKRVGRGLSKPGVILSKKRGIPRFYVDENDPTVFVRVLNGNQSRGHMVNGEFVAF